MFTYARCVDKRDHVGHLLAKCGLKASAGDQGKELRGAEEVREAYDRNNKVVKAAYCGFNATATVNFAGRVR